MRAVREVPTPRRQRLVPSVWVRCLVEVVRAVVGLLHPSLLLLAFYALTVLQAGVELLFQASFRQRELSIIRILLRYLQRQSLMPSLGEGCAPIWLLLLCQYPPWAQPLPTHLRPVWKLLGPDL